MAFKILGALLTLCLVFGGLSVLLRKKIEVEHIIDEETKKYYLWYPRGWILNISWIFFIIFVILLYLCMLNDYKFI